MNKLKLFLSNILIYGLGGVIGKIIPVIMVPVITRILPDSSYFGLNDQVSMLTSAAQSIAVMGMYDAMYRLYFEKEDIDYKKSVCSTALGFTLIMSVVVSCVLLLFRLPLSLVFFRGRHYAYLIYFCAATNLTGSTNSIIAAPTRMQNKRGVYLTINSLTPVVSYGIALFFLLRGYYTLAIPTAVLISGLATELAFALLNRKWFKPSSIDWTLLKPLLAIGVPIFPVFIIYWVFNSCDKLMITNMLGLGAEGIYAVGSKLGHASQLIYTAFSGGWQYFALSTMKEHDQVKNNSIVFEYLGIISFAATMFICAWAYPLFRYIFPAEYLEGYIIAPYLFLAPLLLMLYQVIGNQFLVIKKTWPSLLILCCGALANVGLNLLLIPMLGIEGAAIATLAGYVVTVIICSAVLLKVRLMVISMRFLVSGGLMSLYFIMWRLLFSDRPWLGTCAAVLGTCFLLWLYRRDITRLLAMILTETKKERRKKWFCKIT